jgi:hypothetical protein
MAGCGAPAITQFVRAASCRRRNSSAAKAGMRSFGSGISSSGATKGTFSAGSSLTCASEFSSYRKPPLGGNVGAAETLTAPFRDRMKWRVLQQLRAAPFHPGVRGEIPRSGGIFRAQWVQIPSGNRSSRKQPESSYGGNEVAEAFG